MEIDSRFIHSIDSQYFIIADYMWWAENETEIHNWMEDNLPNGVNHHEGMVVSIKDEKDRFHFLLRWA